jgi:hypothetical protein
VPVWRSGGGNGPTLMSDPAQTWPPCSIGSSLFLFRETETTEYV